MPVQPTTVQMETQVIDKAVGIDRKLNAQQREQCHNKRREDCNKTPFTFKNNTNNDSHNFAKALTEKKSRKRYLIEEIIKITFFKAMKSIIANDVQDTGIKTTSSTLWKTGHATL